MKNLLIITFCFFFTIGGSSQNLPNGDFETWKTVESYTIKDYFTFGNVSRTEDVKQGSYAVKLETKYDASSGQGTLGLISSTSKFDEGELEGFPYTEKPLSMRFWAKYDIALGDAGQVAIYFIKNADVIAIAEIKLEGNTGDTFQYFSIPITWGAGFSPDSAVVLASSHELGNDEYNGKGFLIVDDLHLATISTRNAPIPNEGFENWTIESNEVLDNWFTTDNYLEQLGAKLIGDKFVSKEPVGRVGNALKLENKMLNGEVVAGFSITGNDLNGLEKPTFKVNKQWEYLEGYYKFLPSGGDKATITLIMFQKGIKIGFATFQIGTKMETFKYFSEKISYPIPSLIPDSATLFIASSNPDDPKGTSTVLTVDDINLSDQALSINRAQTTKLLAYPMPFSKVIHFEGINQLEKSNYRIYSNTGQLVKQGIIISNEINNLEQLKLGVYTLIIEGKNVSYQKMIIKQ